MPNSINTMTKLWKMDVSDIASATPICIRKIQMLATAKADIAYFYSLPGSTTADSDNHFTNITFESDNTTITDAGSTTKWGSAAVNDWVHISECSDVTNNGWYLLSATSSSNQFDVEKGVNPLNAGGSATARIAIYTPTECMMLVGDTPDGTAFLHPTLDWGDKGRWFENLSFKEGTSDNITMYIYIR